VSGGGVPEAYTGSACVQNFEPCKLFPFQRQNATIIAFELALSGRMTAGGTGKKLMNSTLGISLMASLVALSSSVTAQEKSLPVQTVEERLDASGDSGCHLRMPGIAEPANQYDAYMSEHCRAEKTGTVEAASVIRDAGAAYREFLRAR